LEPRLRQEALFTFAVELVQAQARVQPLLLLLLDAHWMDEASQALVMALGRVAARAPVLLMPVHRSALTEDRYLLPELDQLDGYYHLALGPLAPEAIAALVAARLAVAQDGVSRLAMSLIQARAQGMVFLAEALVEALREGGHLALREGVWDLSAGLVRTLREANCLEKDPASGAWLLCPDAPLSAVSLDIPDSIHGIVLSRVDRLPETHKATLKVASVVGRVFELEVLGAAHPARLEPEDLQAQQAVLEQRDFVRPEVPGAVYAFANNALQEVVYETLPGTQQRELHGAVGAALEGQQAENVERLAYHYGRATDKSRDRAMFYLDKAAHKAQREYANETALNYYNQALALEERWQWRKGQTETLHILGRRELEKEALRVLEKLPEAPAGDVAYLWGEYHEAVSDYAQAQDAVERALAASREGADRVGGANCLAQLGLIARRQGDYEGAKGWYGQALDLLRGDATLSLEESLTLAPALIGLGIVHRLQGEFDEATACYEQALDLSRESGNRVGEAQALNSLGVTAQYQRRFRQALTYFRQAIEITRAIGDRVSEGLAVANVARCCAETGDYSQAEIYLGEALSHQQAMGNKWAEVNAWNQLGILYQELGDLPRSHDCLSQGLLLSQEIGDQAGEAYLLANLGLVAHDQGNLQAAESLLLDGLALAETQADKYLISVFATYLSSTYLRLGRYAQTIEQASGALALRRTTDLHLFSADNLATLASAYLATADRVLALDYARQALAILDECGGEGPEFPQQDYFTCYQVLQACGQTEAAQHALNSAYGLVMKHAQKIVDPAMRQSFLERVPGNRQIVQEVGNAKHRDQGPGRI
jgi:tetratricopeptide (TPR) repeat protein